MRQPVYDRVMSLTARLAQRCHPQVAEQYAALLSRYARLDTACDAFNAFAGCRRDRTGALLTSDRPYMKPMETHAPGVPSSTHPSPPTIGADVTDVISSAAATILKVITEKVVGRLFDRLFPAKKEAPTPPVQTAQAANNYAQEVGGRVRFIRERLLGFSKRQMCEKLNIESVTQLEKYEAGTEEIPIHITRQIEQEYDVDPAYLDGKTSAVFTRFPTDKDTMIGYLRQGYTPVITTIPRPLEATEKLYCYITFEKHEVDFTRHAVSMLRCSFSSHGGGRGNLHGLIYAMLDLNMNPFSAWVVMATWFSWEAIENGTYSSETSARIGRKTDYDCLDIWAEWCEQVIASRDKWRRMSRDPMMELIANSRFSQLPGTAS